MKATGIVRKLDDLGRITLPIELRRTLDIADRDPLEIFTDENRIILQKYDGNKPVCKICQSDKELIEVNGSFVCKKCALAVSDAVMEG